MLSNELSIPGILKLYCVKKSDLMYTIVGGFSKKIESVMESIHLMIAHCTILVLMHILVFNSCSSLFVTPERFTSTVI